MYLLCAIIYEPDQVVDVLDALMDQGVQGATVLDSMGMAHLMADRLPFFSRFAELGEGESRNKTILVVIPSRDLVEPAIGAIESVIGDLDNQSTGLVFTLPIEHCRGLCAPGKEPRSE